MQKKRSSWKTQFQQIENSSQFHEAVRKIFVTDKFFKNLHCFQEVPIKSLAPMYKYNHYADWYIDELGVVLELHGKQHYSMSNFGNKPYEDAVKDFHNIRYRDNLKREAVIKAGYEYREISFKLKAKLTAEKIKQIIFNKKELL